MKIELIETSKEVFVSDILISFLKENNSSYEIDSLEKSIDILAKVDEATKQEIIEMTLSTLKTKKVKEV